MAPIQPTGAKKSSPLSSIGLSNAVYLGGTHSAFNDLSRTLMAEFPGTPPSPSPSVSKSSTKSPHLAALAALSATHVAIPMPQVTARQVKATPPIGPQLWAGIDNRPIKSLPTTGSLSQLPTPGDSTQKPGLSGFSTVEARTNGPVLRPINDRGWGLARSSKVHPIDGQEKSELRDIKGPVKQIDSGKTDDVSRAPLDRTGVSSFDTSTIKPPSFTSVPPALGPILSKTVDTSVSSNPWASFSSLGGLSRSSRGSSSAAYASPVSRGSADLNSDEVESDVWESSDDLASEGRDSVGDLEGVRRHLSQSETDARAFARAEKAAAVWKAQGQHASAVDSYTDALLYSHDCSQEKKAELLFNRAECYKELGFYKKALRDCSASLDIVPRSIPVLAHRAFLLESLEKYSLALADYKVLKMLAPQCAQYAGGANRMARCS